MRLRAGKERDCGDRSSSKLSASPGDGEQDEARDAPGYLRNSTASPHPALKQSVRTIPCGYVKLNRNEVFGDEDMVKAQVLLAMEVVDGSNSVT